MRMRYIDVNGINTRYICEGEANEKKLLLIHGGGVSADTWCCNIDEFSAKYAVYAPDLLGHGMTDFIDLGDDIRQPHTMNHLYAFIDAIGLKKYVVGGSSYGALISGLLYFERPEQVEKIIMTGSSSSFDTEEDWKKAMEGSFQNASKAIGDATLETCRKRLGNICYDPTVVPEGIILAQLTHYARPGMLDFYTRANRNRVNATKSMVAYRIEERLEKIEAPTVVFTGRNDVRVSVEKTVAGVKRMPNAELIIYEECGHLPYIEHPERFNREVVEFIER